MIVSAGHGEYGYDPRVVTVLWDPYDDGIYHTIEDMTEAEQRELFKQTVGVEAPAGADLTWEQVWKVEGGDVAGWFDRLLVDIATPPTGDDTTYDYWPSGIRLARQVAASLPAEKREELEAVVRVVLVAIGLGADEVGLASEADKGGTN